MKQVKATHNWIKLLSAFWLIVAVQFGVVPPEEKQQHSADISWQIESGSGQPNVDYLYKEKTFTDSKDLSGLKNLNIFPDFFDARIFSEPPLPSWPDESRITSYFKIVSYQYFISSLS